MSQLCQRWLVWSFLFFTGLIFSGVEAGLKPASILAGQVDSFVSQPTQLVASLSSSQQVQQGVDNYQVGKFIEAIKLWHQALPEVKSPQERAIIHSNLALAYRQIGQLSQAISQWEQAIEIYKSQNNHQGHRQLAQLMTEQAQAYSDLGQHRRALTLLNSAVKLSQEVQDQLTEAAALGALGNAYWSLGNYEQALPVHEKSLKIARDLNNPSYITTALNNLGNVYVSQAARYRYQATIAKSEGEDQQAEQLIQLAARDATTAREKLEQGLETSQAVGGIVKVRALLNLNHLLEASSPSDPQIVSNRNRASDLLEQLPNSRDKAYALVNIAVGTNLHSLTSSQDSDQTSKTPQSQPLLEKALQVARNIGDRRAESFALGTLGQLYESSKQYTKAMELTRQAQLAAQEVNAADSLYRWQWQVGRILTATGEKQQAITSYNQAIATLQSIRGDLVVANKELQFNFRDDVEPVYRGLMELILDPSAENRVAEALKTSAPERNGTDQLTKETPQKKVIATLESLKLAELQNFFGDECVQVALSKSEGNTAAADQKTALIYSVILEKHTEMILQLPDGTMTSYRINKTKDELQKEIDQLRLSLESWDDESYIPQVRKAYDLLIRPMEADLAAANPQTLVFINDGVLRQIPLSALHDGQQYLIQKYAIATTPSLSLTVRKPPANEKLKTLILGLTVKIAPFDSLTNVKDEVAAVQKIMGGTELIDSQFTLGNLQGQLQKESYPIVHMATHGKFGIDAENTFLLGYDKRISIEQMDNLLRSRSGKQPVELLTLSACQTAAGDNRSALGIAGVAVRAGVESALATLWYINDAATVPLIQEFYTQLRQPGVTKAEALQKAQLKLIADQYYNHPAVWSPFILIGNWL